MSTQQQALIIETVASIRRTLKRKAYDSDSDSSIDHITNRGNKLKRRARFVKEGRLAPPTGPAAYKEIAEHAGYQRAIINENPPLVDEEGYDLDSDDNEEHVQEAIAAAQEANPYSAVRIEQLLAPLTAVTDLPNHPTLSKPYLSKALPELVKQGCNLTHKENAALWKAKPLLTRLIGDNTWAPCGIMLDPSGLEFFTDTTRFFRPPAKALTAPGFITDEASPQEAGPSAQVNGSHHTNRTQIANGEGAAQAENGKGKGKEVADTTAQSSPESDRKVNGSVRPGDRPDVDNDTSAADNATKASEDVDMAEASSSVAQLGVVAKRTGEDQGAAAGADPVDEPFIHPLFLPPRSAQPDRDLGLPEAEAEDVRRLLQLYVQKQEEVCRGTKKLYEGLLKADRYRKTVWQWAKAEAHCGPNRDMSDGEDWYDKEEWRLSEDLVKGADEVEEDSVQPQKKTRNRR